MVKFVGRGWVGGCGGANHVVSLGLDLGLWW